MYCLSSACVPPKILLLGATRSSVHRYNYGSACWIEESNRERRECFASGHFMDDGPTRSYRKGLGPRCPGRVQCLDDVDLVNEYRCIPTRLSKPSYLWLQILHVPLLLDRTWLRGFHMPLLVYQYPTLARIVFSADTVL
jgi:hypothetical protein